MSKRKVFNIGFHKTGTSSLTQFMRELGFSCLHSVSHSMRHLGLGTQDDVADDGASPANLDALIDESKLITLVQKFEFFSDNPWPLLYKRLNHSFPGSYFILTKREVESWMDSLVRHTANRQTRMQQMIYGHTNPDLHRSVYKKIYLAHNDAVEAYFYGKRNFISIDLEEENAIIAQNLLEFLNLDNMCQDFPLLNRRDD